MKKSLLLLLLIVPGVAHALLPNYCNLLQLPGWWGSGDYMLVWRKERHYPALITTNTAGLFPIIGNAGTEVLFGDKYYGDSPLSGGRGDMGIWLTCSLGCGGTYFNLGRESVDYDRGVDEGTGMPILGRPYFDTTAGVEAAELVTYPALLPNGFVSVNTTNSIWGGDLYARYRMLGSGCFKFDLLGGFRFIRLDDDIAINSNSTSAVLTTVDILDHFATRNDFYSGLIGFEAELRSQCWALQAIGKVGLGNMVKRTHIYGQTTTTLGGVTTVASGGLLAEGSNSGHHSINQFEVIPEINAQAQLRLVPHLWLSVGYQYIFWPHILLAGDQIDLDVDVTQATPHPAFIPHNTSFWAQGLTVGFYFLY